MGKKHKKFLKSEKAKVKLKGNKLKGPQNITKTDFKVRKIVITEQLKNVQVKEQGVRKVHSITDCLARLKNSSSSEVISNLKEIILYQPDDFQKHLESIIKIVANLSLSIEKVDRKECYKILDIICAHTTEQNLRPFFPILVTFLKCAMTHIKPAIQEDSLLMMDVLLRHAPQLVATERDNILTPYLDMVSKMSGEAKPERTLSLQLGNKITSMRWRKNVLERLILFLKCISNQERQVEKVDCDVQAREIIVDSKCEYLGSPYSQLLNSYFYNSIPLPAIENHLKVTTAKPIASDVKISKYADLIMPLMFETWMEIKPTQSKTIDGAIRSSVSFESSLMLKMVMDIIHELYQMVEDTSEEAKKKFLKKHQERFELHLVAAFPYIQDDASKKTPESGGAKCVYQNATICLLFIIFTAQDKQRFWKHRERIFSFIEDCIVNWKPKDAEFNKLMKKFIRTLFTPALRSVFPTESKSVFNQLVRQCNMDQSNYDPKLALVCEIIETCERSKKDSTYSELVPQMVKVLSQRQSVPVHIIKTVSTLAKQGNQTVFDHLENTIVDIVKNLLGGLRISGSFNSDPLRWKFEIANLAYWVSKQETLEAIEKELKDDEISKYLRDIVSIKKSE